MILSHCTYIFFNTAQAIMYAVVFTGTSVSSEPLLGTIQQIPSAGERFFQSEKFTIVFVLHQASPHWRESAQPS